MKVLEMVNKKGIKRYYSGFHCTPFLMDNEIWYALDAVFFESVSRCDVIDVLECKSDLTLVMNHCVELVKQLEEQPSVNSNDSLYKAYYNQATTKSYQ